jgi:hypothetical protein
MIGKVSRLFVWGCVALLLFVMFPLQAQEQAPQGFFIEAFVDNANPYVGEPVLYTFRLYSRQDFASPPEYAPPEFSGFWQGETFDPRAYPEIVGDATYMVTEVRTVLYPNSPGAVVIEPAGLSLPVTVFEDAQVYLTDTVTVEVRALPENAPQEFTGAVGILDFSFTLEQSTLALGEPALLRLVVSGWGNIEQMPAPVLTLPEDWRVYTNRSRYSSHQQDGAVVGERHFEWLFVPSEAGTHQVPALTVAYFNPVDGAYHTLATEALQVDVLPGENQMMALDLFDERPPLPLKPLQGSLRVAGASGLGLGWIILWLIPPLGFGVGWFWRRKRNEQIANRLVIRQEKALKQALANLKQAEATTGADAYRQVSAVIYAYVSDKAMREDIAGLSQQVLLTIFTEQGFKSGLKQQVIACLEQADSGLYAPVDAADKASLIRNAEKALVALDAVWEKA